MPLPLCLNDSIDYIVKCNNYQRDQLKCTVIINNNFNETCLFDYDNGIDFLYNISANEAFFILNNYLYNFSVLSFVFCFAILFSCLFLAHCVYNPMITQFKIELDKNRELYETDAYLFEYLEEFYELSNNDLSGDFLKSLKFKYIKQETPKGCVLMNYDYKNESFNYYSKKSNIIPFQYLDVVSRIYVVKYNCKSLYIDNYDNLDKDRDKDNDNDKDNDMNVYLDTSYSCFYKPSKSIISKTKKLEFKSNKFKYLGTIEKFVTNCKYNNYRINNSNIDISNQKFQSEYNINEENKANDLFFINKYNDLNEDQNLNEDQDLNEDQNRNENQKENLNENQNRNENQKENLSDNSSDNLECDEISNISSLNSNEKFQIKERNISFKSFKKIFSSNKN
tara:strand:- start:130 stop:1311 length:1182 start_codon:yes stop_codon:yes gene_type:complete